MPSSPSPDHSPEVAALALDSFPLGISIVDGEGRILLTNAAADRILGLSAAEHRARTLRSPEWKIFHADGTLFRLEELPAYRAFHEQIRIEEPALGVLRPDGEVAWLSATATPLGAHQVVLTYG